jgi:hypothetical protein
VLLVDRNNYHHDAFDHQTRRIAMVEASAVSRQTQSFLAALLEMGRGKSASLGERWCFGQEPLHYDAVLVLRAVVAWAHQ